MAGPEPPPPAGGLDPDEGPSWDERAALDELAAVIDYRDTGGVKNRVIDRAHKAALARALPSIRGLQVLDFGCGTGRISGWLAERGAHPVGVDSSTGMIDAARHAHPGLRFEVVDGFALPVEPATQDAVVTVDVLQYHVSASDRMGAILSEFARVLRPGGTVVAIEQVQPQAGERGAPPDAYVAALEAAGFGSVATVPLRIGRSRVLETVTLRPVLASLPLVPWALAREGRRRLAAELAEGRYGEVVFRGSLPARV